MWKILIYNINMKVYRYAHEKELQAILNGNIEKIGGRYSEIKYNTHKYKSTKKYLHFFKDIRSIKDVQNLYNDYGSKYYICEYDIPMMILLSGRGVGFYSPSGYDCDYNKCVEYIVSTDKFKSSWLKRYVPDIENIEFELT